MDQGRKTVFVRVYSGELAADSEILNATRGVKERVARLFLTHANKREKIKSATVGSIALVVGLKETKTGDTLTSPLAPLILESVETYLPVISIAIEPQTRSDQEKLIFCLDKIAQEDPSFVYAENPETGQLLISGMGELHLEIIVDRLRREYNVEVQTGKPQVVYKESVSSRAEARVVFDREIHDVRHFGDVTLSVINGDRGSGFVFEASEKMRQLVPELIQHIENGAREATLAGAIAGNEVVDLIVKLEAVGTEPSSMSPLGVKVAASQACREACEKAGPIILEPFMSVEVVAPEEFVGEVIADLNSRHGRLEEITPRGKISVLKAISPLANMFGYSTSLRSITQGRGIFSMQYSHYDVKQ